MLNTTVPDWHRHALCVDHPNPDMWFADGRTLQARTAIAICQTCPAQTQCLTEALRNEGTESHHFRTGIYGGKTPTERAKIRTVRYCVNCKQTPVTGLQKRCHICPQTKHQRLAARKKADA